MTKKDYSTSNILLLDSIVHTHGGKNTVERFWEKVDTSPGQGPWGDCLVWVGAKNGDNYGAIGVSCYGVRFNLYAHQFSYMIAHGSIDRNLTIDHLCRNHPCVNDSHLEQVTHRINLLRGIAPAAFRAKQTHCKNGHIFDEVNTYIKSNGTRCCMVCRADHAKEYRKTEKWKIWKSNQAPEALPTSCPSGHLYTEETTLFISNGHRRCLLCFTPKKEHGPSRAHKDKTECKYGHPYNEENTYYAKNGSRHCRICNKEKLIAYRKTDTWQEWYTNRKKLGA